MLMSGCITYTPTHPHIHAHTRQHIELKAEAEAGTEDTSFQFLGDKHRSDVCGGLGQLVRQPAVCEESVVLQSFRNVVSSSLCGSLLP